MKHRFRFHERRKSAFREHACRLLLALLLAAPAHGQVIDICGCEGHPESLGTVDLRDASTYPPGLIPFEGYRYVYFQVPESGVLIFDNLYIYPRTGANGTPRSDDSVLTLYFNRNTSNTAVTILVAGDFEIGPNSSCSIQLSGAAGTAGNTSINGVGGSGGPGGFRGGDGAYQAINFASNGGYGAGPGGGRGGLVPGDLNAQGGTFIGNSDLLPLIGGCGGGGGASSNGSFGTAGGGGGGGGGAMLLAANGRILINGYIYADGGTYGSRGSSAAGYAAGGSGGAIRLVASSISGSGRVLARGGGGPFGGSTSGSDGRIRMEAFSNSFPGNFTTPPAIRAPAPGPIVNPFTPTVKILSVGGEPSPAVPRGITGTIDIILPAPGLTPVVVETTGVPIGTTIEVTAKPKVGGAPITQTAELGASGSICDGSGECTTTINFDLAAGAYIFEARATLQTPAPEL